MTTFRDSLRSYEDWLRAQIPGYVVEDDLKRKRKKIRGDPFTFLRGTCWRWAESARELARGLAEAPVVLSLGDAHVENFGLWRDSEMRLVWGANDFDEAAKTPYTFDLIRLGASAVLANRGSATTITDNILDGYRRALDAPHPFILETEQLWLRDLFGATDAMRTAFWDEEIFALPSEPQPGAKIQQVLREALPAHAKDITFAPRTAGVGSRGRARFIASATLYGAPLVREAKALAPSCWTRETGYEAVDSMRVARGPNRAPDRYLTVRDGFVLRRLGPDSRKLEQKDGVTALAPRLLRAMGGELANIHAASKPAAKAVSTHLAATGAKPFAKAVARVAEATEAEWKAFSAS
jgi:Uncharacterized protein conserved in bacteria (DUF2252)